MLPIQRLGGLHCMDKALEYAKRIAYSTEETLMFTYEQAKKYADREGVYVEAGVAAGAQIIAMACGAPNKTIYAFDSFEGIPMPCDKDDQFPGLRMLNEGEKLPEYGKQELVSTGATSVTLDDFFKNLELSGVFHTEIYPIKGWFEETVPWINQPKPMPPISILRLDGDLYSSTMVCLLHLFPKVIQGGCVIIDDIQLKGCKDAVDEYFNLIGYNPDFKYVSNITYFYK